MMCRGSPAFTDIKPVLIQLDVMGTAMVGCASAAQKQRMNVTAY